MHDRLQLLEDLSSFAYYHRTNNRISTAVLLDKVRTYIETLEKERDLYKTQADSLHLKISTALAETSELNNKLDELIRMVKSR
jgi:hypothetical protein